MLDRYIQNQIDLAGIESHFRCPDNCNAPGCTLADVIVEVTLFDLIRMSLFLNMPVSSLFFDHCHIGLQDSEFNIRYQRLVIKLKKPCHFLQTKRCRVHSSKPLNCVLFPEYHQLTDILPELNRLPVFRLFPCLKGDITITAERSQALKSLRHMSRREEALSFYYLFGTPFFIVDSKPLTRILKRDNPKKQPVSIRDYDRCFEEKLKSTGIFESIRDKISKLDTRAGMEGFYKKLEDDALMRTLLEKMEKPEVVYILKGEQFKKIKRNLQRPVIVSM